MVMCAVPTALSSSPKRPSVYSMPGRRRSDIAGLTLEELVQRIGFEADDLPAAFHVAGYLRSWSRPGYTISVLFESEDGRAIRIPQGVPFEELG